MPGTGPLPPSAVRNMSGTLYWQLYWLMPCVGHGTSMSVTIYVTLSGTYQEYIRNTILIHVTCRVWDINVSHYILNSKLFSKVPGIVSFAIPCPVAVVWDIQNLVTIWVLLAALSNSFQPHHHAWCIGWWGAGCKFMNIISLIWGL